MEKISFFDQIDNNKRNSAILMVVMFLIFIGMVTAISYAFDIGICGPTFGFFALLFYSIAVFFTGDKVILALTGAKPVKKKDYPYLYNIVEGMALASQIPVPKIYVINDESPNAFATGRDPKHASVAFTTGLLKMMKKQELEGVVAHEISHIANYDILIIIALIFIILAPIFAQLVRFAISRQREYLADANGARITRYPQGLASALEKIKAANIPTKAANDTTASLFFSNPFPHKIGFLGSTHPKIDDRISKLRAM